MHLRDKGIYWGIKLKDSKHENEILEQYIIPLGSRAWVVCTYKRNDRKTRINLIACRENNTKNHSKWQKFVEMELYSTQSSALKLTLYEWKNKLNSETS